MTKYMQVSNISEGSIHWKHFKPSRYLYLLYHLIPIMYYADVHKRQFIKGTKQYEHFREENTALHDVFFRFPRLPRNQMVKYHKQWEFPDFHVQKISYYVEPKVEVSAYLLLPTEISGTTSGILALHQHNDEYKAGKSELIGMVKNPDYTKLEAVDPDPSHVTPDSKRQFAFASELCKKGHVILVPDFMGFEEYRDRNWPLDDYYADKQFLRGYEEMLSSKYILFGSSTMAKHLHDSYVAVTVLSSIDQVDPTKIGVIGHSLGGEVASVLTTFDERIKVGVSSCGTVCYQDFLKSNRMESAEAIIPGFLGTSRDFDFYLDLIPPTPFLAINSSSDLSPSCQELLLDKPRNNFTSRIFEGTHSFPPEMRKLAYDFIAMQF